MWLFGQDPIKVSYHPTNFGGYEDFDIGDIMFINIYHFSQILHM